MYFIGITGGVGAGKSEILQCLAGLDGAAVLRADDLAKELIKPGHACHDRLAEAFAQDGIFDADGRLLTERMSRQIFRDERKRQLANAIIHPAVRDEILQRVAQERKRGRLDFFFLEAALLLEEHYDEICDEIWYIYASEQTRRKRLRESRGYTDEKILASQLTEGEFRRRCQRIIDNDGKLETAKEQVRDFAGRLRSGQTESGKQRAGRMHSLPTEEKNG